jgi:CysZ protein
MLQPLIRAVSQLNDRVFLGVVWRSLALSVLAFLALLGGSVWLVAELVGQGGWLGWLAGIAGGLGVLLVAVWLFVPVALLIATLYVDRIASAVERRFYPGLPAPAGAPLTEQTWDGVVLGMQVLVLQVFTLVASLALPGVGLALGWVVTGWAIGRGLFVAVAMRRMPRPQALQAYERRRLKAVAPGIALALASTLRPLNLLVPVVGIAALVHVLQER